MVERKRHLAKAVTYRVFGSAGTAVIASVATGDAALGASIGLLDSVVKVGLYYVHERAWYRVRWGVRAEPASFSEGPVRAGRARGA
jgi:uncharacterized membrane protein